MPKLSKVVLDEVQIKAVQQLVDLYGIAIDAAQTIRDRAQMELDLANGNVNRLVKKLLETNEQLLDLKANRWWAETK